MRGKFTSARESRNFVIANACGQVRRRVQVGVPTLSSAPMVLRATDLRGLIGPLADPLLTDEGIAAAVAAVEALRHFAADNAEGQLAVREMGVLPLLVRLLDPAAPQEASGGEDAVPWRFKYGCVRIAACKAVVALVARCTTNQSALCQHGSIEVLCGMVSSLAVEELASKEESDAACAALSALLSGSRANQLVAHGAGVLPPLLALIAHAPHRSARSCALSALCALVGGNAEMRAVAVEAGAIACAVALLPERVGEADLDGTREVELTLAAIRQLTAGCDGARRVLLHCGGVERVLALMSGPTVVAVAACETFAYCAGPEVAQSVCATSGGVLTLLGLLKREADAVGAQHAGAAADRFAAAARSASAAASATAASAAASSGRSRLRAGVRRVVADELNDDAAAYALASAEATFARSASSKANEALRSAACRAIGALAAGGAVCQGTLLGYGATPLLLEAAGLAEGWQASWEGDEPICGPVPYVPYRSQRSPPSPKLLAAAHDALAFLLAGCPPVQARVNYFDGGRAVLRARHLAHESVAVRAAACSMLVALADHNQYAQAILNEPNHGYGGMEQLIPLLLSTISPDVELQQVAPLAATLVGFISAADSKRLAARGWKGDLREIPGLHALREMLTCGFPKLAAASLVPLLQLVAAQPAAASRVVERPEPRGSPSRSAQTLVSLLGVPRRRPELGKLYGASEDEARAEDEAVAEAVGVAQVAATLIAKVAEGRAQAQEPLCAAGAVGALLALLEDGAEPEAAELKRVLGRLGDKVKGSQPSSASAQREFLDEWEALTERREVLEAAVAARQRALDELGKGEDDEEGGGGERREEGARLGRSAAKAGAVAAPSRPLTPTQRASSAALGGLAALCRGSRAAQAEVLRLGGLPMLLRIVRSGPHEMVLGALCALTSAVAANAECCEAVLDQRGGIEVVGSQLDPRSQPGAATHAAHALLHLAAVSAESRDAVREAGLIRPLVAFNAQARGGPRLASDHALYHLAAASEPNGRAISEARSLVRAGQLDYAWLGVAGTAADLLVGGEPDHDRDPGPTGPQRQDSASSVAPTDDAPPIAWRRAPSRVLRQLRWPGNWAGRKTRRRKKDSSSQAEPEPEPEPEASRRHRALSWRPPVPRNGFSLHRKVETPRL